MAVRRPAFISTRTDEERVKDSGKVLTIRLSEEELVNLRATMALLDIGQEGTALKFLAELGQNVVHRQFPADWLRWVARRDRARS